MPAGSFVFDWGWAEAYERNGFDYYPKLISAIPFTPSSGPRIGIAAGQNRTEVLIELIKALNQQAREQEISGSRPGNRRYPAGTYCFLTLQVRKRRNCALPMCFSGMMFSFTG
jgi:hypothetical protein